MGQISWPKNGQLGSRPAYVFFGEKRQKKKVPQIFSGCKMRDRAFWAHLPKVRNAKLLGMISIGCNGVCYVFCVSRRLANQDKFRPEMRWSIKPISPRMVMGPVANRSREKIVMIETALRKARPTEMSLGM